MFAQDTITWRIHRDPLLGIAALRGLFLHALHPLAMGALEEHGGEWDPWKRLARTARYIGASTFGTTGEAMLAGSRLRSVHAQVHCTTRQGREYTAENPDLLIWVHNCMASSFLDVVTRGGMALTDAEQDQYLNEQVRAAALVGLEPEQVPHDRAQLEEYFEHSRPLLVATRSARNAVTRALMPQLPTAPSGDRPPWAGVAGLAFSALPTWARQLYELPELTEATTLSPEATDVGLRRLRVTLDGHPWARPPRRQDTGSLPTQDFPTCQDPQDHPPHTP